MSTPHIKAKYGDFAKTVLMPGDPLRSEYIAKTFLSDPNLVNNVRGVCGYTGYYKDKKISVMASGMGMPSIGIYSYELYNFYGVENIIRVGTCGALIKDVHVKDIIIAQGACTNGNFASQYKLPGTYCPLADFGLLKEAEKQCLNANIRFKIGNILSSDNYYDDSESTTAWAKMGVLGVEMEAAALYCTAARAGKKALCICTVSDSLIFTDENTTPDERERFFTDMMKIALETGYAFS